MKRERVEATLADLKRERESVRERYHALNGQVVILEAMLKEWDVEPVDASPDALIEGVAPA